MSTQDLDQNAIDSLFSAAAEQPQAVPVDFAVRRSLTTGQMKTLVNLNQPFTRNVSAYLSNWLDADIRISMIAAERVLYRHHLDTFDPDTMYMVKGRFQDLGAPALLQMDVSCVDALVHLGLGGRPDLPEIPSSRDLTSIDSAVVEIFLSTFWEELNQVWTLSGLQATFERRVLSPDLLKVFPYSEYLLLFTYGINIGSIEGILQLSLSTGTADVLLRAIEHQDTQRMQSPEIKALLHQRLLQIPLKGTLRIPPFPLTAATIRDLKPGSILPTGVPSNTSFELHLAGGPVWRALAKGRNDRIVAELIKEAPQNDV